MDFNRQQWGGEGRQCPVDPTVWVLAACFLGARLLEAQELRSW
jgi:hypothetical protein